MHVLKTLLIMQLRDVFDLSFLKRKKQLLFKVVFYVLALAGYTLVAVYLFNQSIKLNILTLTGRLPETVIIFIFTLMIFLSIINCTIGLTKSLYYSSDNPILLTMPAKPNVVFLSKLIVYYIRELIRNFTFIVPVFIAFGLVNSFNTGFYFILIFCYLFISLLPVLIGAILSIPSLFISIFLRNKPYFIFAIYLVIASLITYLIFSIVKTIPANFNIIEQFSVYYWSIQSFLNNFADKFALFAELTRMIIGKSSFFAHIALPASSVITFFIFIALLAVLAVFVYFVSRPLYFKMASKPFEYNKKTNLKAGKNKTGSQYFTALKKEILTNVRTPGMFIKNFALLFILPVAIFLLNKIFTSMDTRLEGDVMCMAFNVLLILLIVLSFNTSTAEIFSNEGKAFYQFKTTPIKTKNKFAAKLSLNIFATTLAVLATSIVYSAFSKNNIFASAAMFFTVMFVAIGYMLWCAQFDLLNPQWALYNNEQTTSSNPNITKGTALAFLVAFLVFIFSWKLFSEGITLAWVKLFVAALAFLIIRLYFFAANVKAYFSSF